MISLSDEDDISDDENPHANLEAFEAAFDVLLDQVVNWHYTNNGEALKEHLENNFNRTTKGTVRTLKDTKVKINPKPRVKGGAIQDDRPNILFACIFSDEKLSIRYLKLALTCPICLEYASANRTPTKFCSYW